MKPKNLSLTALVLLTMVLGACTRPASAPPQATPTLENNFPAGSAQATPSMNIIEQIATQTAMAQNGGVPAQTEVVGTAVAVDSGAADTATPLAGIDTTPIVINPSDLGITPTDTPLPSPTGGASTDVTPAPLATVETTRPATYTLQAGEFPYCIARRFDVDPGELLSLNGLTDGQLYSPGLVLQIPSTGNPFPGGRALKTHPDTYTVLSGDTVYSVACQYGDVDPLNIAAVNGLTAPYTLTVGAQIQIP